MATASTPRGELPTGTVTFLFTDVEGSTRLLNELGSERYGQALAEHRGVLRDAFGRHGGAEVDTQGDAFFVAFATAEGALDAAREATDALARGPFRVRIGIHTGSPLLTSEGYVGTDVHRASRIAAAGHGGQVLVSSATAALLATSNLRDLGEHRLKDLSAPERIYQLGDADFPPLKSLYQTNLPVPATAFVGREDDVRALSELLRRDDVRLVTLTGPGGTGKTRLALQVAGELADRYPAGVWWVPLAPIRDPQLVLETAAKAVGAQGEIGEHIGNEQMLLLFDNFEQVTAAAPEVGALLDRCLGLNVLVTSREALHLRGEWEYAVDPLPQPDAEVLFNTRALAARRDFIGTGEVRQICLRLDNLPLAIELAAARVKVLTPQALLERLEQRLPVLAGGARDAPERQRTLGATIEWSHELLSADERRLFARLSVFRGGWTLEAAETICAADLDTLQSLVDKSLVRQRDDRFSMLETIREYAADRLGASGEAEQAGRRHAEYFLTLAEKSEPQLRGSPRECLDRLEREHDNLRAAFDRLVGSNDWLPAMRLGGALWRFWSMRGHFAEGLRRLETLLAGDDRPTLERASVLNGATALAVNSGRAETAKTSAEAALSIHHDLGDQWGIANSKFLLGLVLTEEEDWRGARKLFEEALAKFTELGDDHYMLLVTRDLAWMLYELGEHDRARVLSEENVRRARAVGNKRMEATTLQGLAWRAVDEGRPQEALTLLTTSYALNRQIDEAAAVEQDIFRLGRALFAIGRTTDSAMLISRSTMITEQIGVDFERAARAKLIEALRAQLGELEFAKVWEQGRNLTLDEAVALANGGKLAST